MAVVLQTAEYDVHDPQREEEGGRRHPIVAAEFSPASRMPTPQHQHGDGGESEDAVDRNGERQIAGQHDERRTVYGVLYGRYRPRQTDAQEHVDGVASGDVADRAVGVLVSDSGHLRGERICTRTELGDVRKAYNAPWFVNVTAYIRMNWVNFHSVFQK